MHKKKIIDNDFRPGDVVEVRSAREILSTLDDFGTLDSLPFMPEMLAFCGKKHRVFRRIAKTCVDEAAFREFLYEDVFLLEDANCTGDSHGGCNRNCPIFWKKAWLRKETKIEYFPQTELSDDESSVLFDNIFCDGHFICQSTELARVTRPLSLPGKIRVFFHEIKVGTYRYKDIFRLLFIPVVLKHVKRLLMRTVWQS